MAPGARFGACAQATPSLGSGGPRLTCLRRLFNSAAVGDKLLLAMGSNRISPRLGRLGTRRTRRRIAKVGPGSEKKVQV